MYTMSTSIDSRELILNKFMKKTRPLTRTEHNVEIDHLDENEPQYDEIDEVGDKEHVTYNYLTDDPLSKEFNHDDDYLNNKQISVCMYTINTETKLPYVTYLLSEVDGVLLFPNVSHHRQQNMGDNEDLEEDQEYILPNEDINENEIQNTKEITDDENLDTKENASKNDYLADPLFVLGSQYIEKNVNNDSVLQYERYKGYIETSDGDLFLFFDITDIECNEENHVQYTSCIIDEIINTKEISGKKLSNNIVELFKSENLLTYMYDKNNNPAYCPIVVHLCENQNGGYVSSLYTDNKIEYRSLIGNEVDHPVVGNGHLFSKSILGTDISSIVKRFALFHQDAVYVLHDNFEQDEYNMISNKACVCFSYDGEEYWSTKSMELFNEI